MDTKHEFKDSTAPDATITENKSKNINPDDFKKLQDSPSHLPSKESEPVPSQNVPTKLASAKPPIKLLPKSKLSETQKSLKEVTQDIESDPMNLENDESSSIVDENSSTAIGVFEPSSQLSSSSQQIETNINTTTTTVTTTTEKGRIKKKQKVDDDEDVNIGSRSLKVGGSGLDDIFDAEGLLSHFDWSPIDTEYENISFKLDNFGFSNNQTLALKITINPTKGRWCVNICPDKNRDFTDILLHLNPRYGAKECLILNNMQGTWGRTVKRSLIPNARSSSMILVVQIRKEGFYSFINGAFFAFFAHRTDISSLNKLSLQIPAIDSMGTPEAITVHKIWWGHVEETAFTSPKISDDLNIVSENIWLRSVCVDGLPCEKDPHEIYELEKALYALFQDYVPEEVHIVVNKGRAFVRLANIDSVSISISELNNSVLADTFCLIMQPASVVSGLNDE